MATTSKIPALDALRGIAALLVVGGHLQITAFGHFAYLGHIALNVDFFFVLSGYVIARAYEHRMILGLGAMEYARIRLARLYPLIALGTLLGFVVALAGANPTDDVGLKLLAQLLFIPSLWTANETFILNNVQWSLLVELAVNFTHFGLVRWATRLRLALVAIVFGITFFALVHYYNLENLGWVRETFLAGFPRGVFGFTAGILLFRLTKSGQLPAVKIHWTLLALALPLVAIIASTHRMEWRWYADPALAVFVMPVICWAGIHCKIPDRLNGVAQFLGDLSYPVYALHLPLIYGLTAITRAIAGANVAPIFIYVTWIPVIIFVSWVAMVLIDMPLQKWFKRSGGVSLPSTL